MTTSNSTPKSSALKCPNCQGSIFMRIRRTAIEKLCRVQAKYRCHHCQRSFGLRKGRSRSTFLEPSGQNDRFSLS